MSTIYFVLALASANLFMIMLPGPDFVLTIKNTLKGGRLCGMATALGIAFGIAVHVTYCWLGVATLIHNSTIFSTLIRWLGACYLIWLGARSLFETGRAQTDSLSANAGQPHSITVGSSFLNGFLTNLLNVKALLYFLSVFSVAVSPNSPIWVHISLALAFVLSALIWFNLLTIIINSTYIRRGLYKYEWIISRGAGTVLIVLGLVVLIG